MPELRPHLVDESRRLAPRLVPSPYLIALARAFLLAPDNTREEDGLRVLFGSQARSERVNGDKLLQHESERLRAEGVR